MARPRAHTGLLLALARAGLDAVGLGLAISIPATQEAALRSELIVLAASPPPDGPRPAKLLRVEFQKLPGAFPGTT